MQWVTSDSGFTVTEYLLMLWILDGSVSENFENVNEWSLINIYVSADDLHWDSIQNYMDVLLSEGQCWWAWWTFWGGDKEAGLG